MANFIPETAIKIDPTNYAGMGLISHTTMEGPIEKFLAYVVGKASTGDLTYIMYAALALAAYLLIFVWYAKQMKKRNAEYAAKAAK